MSTRIHRHEGAPSFSNRLLRRIIRPMKRSAVIALLCVYLAFAASAVVSRAVFERLPHLEDEFAYLYQARIFARGQIMIETPQPVRAYWQPFLINHNGHRFGKYTPGWPALLAMGIGLNQPWVINAWLMMLTVALIYRLGSAIYNRPTGAIAALLVATSPAALLLAGTLMSHISGLFFTTLFLYALWRVERRHHTTRWGAIGGLALGVLVITRPLTAVGIAAPYVIYSLGRVFWAGFRAPDTFGAVLGPLVVLGVVASAISLAWPAYNHRATGLPGEPFGGYLVRFARGDKNTNLYRYIWDYDRVGFGPGHGRRAEGHTLDAGWEHTKTDLKCAARDLFGWALPAEDGLTVEESECLVSSPGYSWLMLPVGLLLGARRRWTWLLAALPLSIIAVYLAYWIGGTVYSARYYAEAIGAAALISAAGIATLARWFNQWASRRQLPRPGAALTLAVAALALYALAVYSPARMRPLRGYGRVAQNQLIALEAARHEPERPVLVIAYGEHHWRDIATLMAMTSPFRDSDIVLARDPNRTDAAQIRAQAPEREILYFVGGELSHAPAAAP